MTNWIWVHKWSFYALLVNSDVFNWDLFPCSSPAELCCLDLFWTHTCTNNSKMQSFCTLSVFTFRNILNSVQSKQLRPSGVVRQPLVAWKNVDQLGSLLIFIPKENVCWELTVGLKYHSKYCFGSGNVLRDVTQFGLWSFVPGLFLHQRDGNYNAFLFSALVLCGSSHNPKVQTSQSKKLQNKSMCCKLYQRCCIWHLEHMHGEAWCHVTLGVQTICFIMLVFHLIHMQWKS